jgi:tetratricopeptide (TPR) repeat protein
VIEEESRRAFAAAVPPEWVVRNINPDYGVDVEVEVFQHGEATGPFFYVQLRATDEPDLTTALKLRFRPAQWAYFGALDRPVLLVRFHAPTEELFATWAHRVDGDLSAASVRVTLVQDQRIDRTSFDHLLLELTTIRSLRSAALDGPLVLGVSVDSRSSRDVDLWVASLRAASAGEYRVRFEATDDPARVPIVRVEPDQIVVHLGVSSVVLHADHAALSLAVVAADVITGLALVLSRVNQHELAASLARRSIPVGSLVEERAVDLAGMFVGGSRLADAIDTGHHLMDVGRRGVAASFALMPVMLLGHRASATEAAAIESLLTRAADDPDGASDLDRSRANYSLANWLFSVGEYGDACTRYALAREQDEGYSGRAYFCAEYAAALFEGGFYDDAASWYEAALTLEFDASLLARLADCHMRAGRYSTALHWFDRYAAEEAIAADSWYLKHATLRWASSLTGIENQERDPQDAIRLAGDPWSDVPDKAERARSALERDLLCPEAWLALSQPHLEQEQDDLDLMMMLLLVALEGGSEVAFAVAAGAAAAAGERDLTGHVVRYAARQHGAVWLGRLLEVAEGLEGEERAILTEAVQAVQSHGDEHRSIVRFHQEDGSWETLEVVTEA